MEGASSSAQSSSVDKPAPQRTFTEMLMEQLGIKTDLRVRKHLKAYVDRWLQYVALGGLVGGVYGGASRLIAARHDAMLEAEQAGVHLRTLSAFSQYRANVHKNVMLAALRSGSKVAAFAGLFGGLELGMTYYRGVWDAWNPLLACTIAGGIYGIPAGFTGIRWGLTLGGALAIPVAFTQIALRALVPESELMPSARLLVDPPDEKMSQAVLEELQFELLADELMNRRTEDKNNTKVM